MKSKTIPLGLTAMILTGFSALLYQTLWIRAFAILLGGNALSISCVIAHFMLGLGLGTAFAPKILQWRWKKSLPLYAICEVLIAMLAGLSFFIVLSHNGWVLDLLRSGFLPKIAMHFLVTGIFIFPVTFLMGFSFPLISYLFPNSREHQWLYSANCLGGALGAFLSFTVLIYYGGLYAALIVGLLGNIFAAVLFKNQKFCFEEATAEESVSIGEKGATSQFGLRLALLLSAFSGFFLLSMEQVWFRLSSFFLGSRLYVPSLVLMVILLCLAVSAWWSPKFSFYSEKKQLKVILSALTASVLSSWLGFHFMSLSVAKTMDLVSPSKKALHPEDFLTLLFIALIPSIALGICFPLSMSLIQKEAKGAWQKTRALSKALYLNTLMSVLGSMLTTYVLFRTLGTVSTLKVFIFGLLLFLALAVFTLASKQAKAIGLAMVFVATAVTARMNVDLSPNPPSMWEAEDEYGYLALIGLQPRGERWAMIHNYISLVGAYGDSETPFVQRNLALFPALIANSVKDVLVIGMGYGLTTEAFSKLAEPESITAVEILPQVVAAQKEMKFKDTGYLQDPRLKNIVDDGRSYLFLANKQWDLISVNVDPYGAGSTALFSVEFYQEVRKKLKPSGAYSQLLYGVAEDVAVMVRTAKNVFPFVKVMPGYENDGFILLAANEDITDWESLPQSRFERVKNLLPSATWGTATLQSVSDLNTAETIAGEASQAMDLKYPDSENVTDSNLRIEKSRVYFGDFFLHYPHSYF